MQTQIAQAESQRLEERARMQGHLQRVEQESQDAKRRVDQESAETRKRLESQAAQRTKTISSGEHARREQERTRAVLGRNRRRSCASEKEEAIKTVLLNREEDISRLKSEQAEARQAFDAEQSRWKESELEKIRKAAFDEEAMRDLPGGSANNGLTSEQKKCRSSRACRRCSS